MARITVEDCLEKVSNRFTLILLAAERSKQLLSGTSALVENDQGNKEVVTSLREVAAGMVAPDLSLMYDDEALIRLSNERAGYTEQAAPVASEIADLPPEIDAELPPEA